MMLTNVILEQKTSLLLDFKKACVYLKSWIQYPRANYCYYILLWWEMLKLLVLLAKLLYFKLMKREELLMSLGCFHFVWSELQLLNMPLFIFIYQRVKIWKATIESWGICTCEDRCRADEDLVILLNSDWRLIYSASILELNTQLGVFP